ncbi:hypothetical protein TWF694_005093 [Orbilia ellipsospora]|uniref:Uncharacterized protein n=1 Tax=Orbilia ellipsospora TaxID=2528407 RepID=A0AAV9WVN2_9PEZI
MNEAQNLRRLSESGHSSYGDNITYQRSFETCRDSTMAIVHLLQEALNIYDDDPDALWSLWMHQSVSFIWESRLVIEVLQEWANIFQPVGAEATEERDWPDDIVKKKLKMAKRSYLERTQRFREDYTCRCTFVNLADRSYSQRFCDLFRSATLCKECKERRAKPQFKWSYIPEEPINVNKLQRTSTPS